MKKKLILVSILAIAVISTGSYLALRPKNATATLSPTLNDKLVNIFGSQAKNLTISEKKVLNGKDITVYRGNHVTFEIDPGNELVAYSRTDANLKPNNPVSVDQAKNQAVNFIKKLLPDQDLSTYKYSQVVRHLGEAVNINEFTWSVQNSNGVEIKRIAVSTTSAGEVINYFHMNNDTRNAEVEPKISSEQATQIVIDQLVKSGSDRNKLQVENVTKKMRRGELNWYVSTIIQSSDPRHFSNSLIEYYVNVSTGELNELP